MGYNSATRTFDTYADLRLQAGSMNTRVTVLGYSTVGDNGGGGFIWDSTSTLVDNDSFIVAVTGVVTGRWIKVDIADVKRYAPIPTYFQYPAGFTYRPAAIYKNRAGQWECNIKEIKDFARQHIDRTISPVYVDPVNGNDSNNGRAPTTAYATIPFALTQSRVIYAMAGFYDRVHSFSSYTDVSAEPLAIIALDPNNTFFSSAEPTTSLVWSLNSGTTYQATRSSVLSVVDMKFKDVYGEYQMYEKKATLAAAQSQFGSWYTDNVIVYVNRLDGSSPDGQVKILLAAGQIIEVSGTGAFYYIEGCRFWGSNVYGALQLRHITEDVQPPTKIYLNNCEFAYNQTPTGGGNGLGVINLTEVWTWNCKAHNNWADGFNYHTNAVSFAKAKIFEKDNVGYNNGVYNTTIINNGSTVHDGIQIIRLGGLFFNNRGPNVADVNAGTQSINIAVTAYDTLIDPSDVNASDFTVADADMYLIECISDGSAISANQAGSGAIYIKNSIYGKRVGNIIYL